MKKAKVLSIIFIIVALLLLWFRVFLDGVYGNIKFGFIGILFWCLIISFAMGVSWFLYRKNWYYVWGLNIKGITKKIIFKAIGIGLLINFIYTVFFLVFYIFVLKEFSSSLFGDKINAIKIFPYAFIIAPFVEELLFRGFIQGLWQNLYVDKEKMPIKLIIVTTAVLFTISHFGFLFNITVLQFFLTLIPILLVSLYIGWLRYKYQSIIPSFFAHIGFNLNMVLMVLLMIIMSFVSPTLRHEINTQMRRIQYANDATPYNFDPNNMDEWKRSFKKFSLLEQKQSLELTKHLNANGISVPVYFTIDTCGKIYNVYVDPVYDSGYYSTFGYSFAKESVEFIQSIPICTPYIVEGKKREKEMCEFVFFHGRK